MKKAILIFTATIVLVIITMLLCMLLFSSCEDNASNKYSNKYSNVDRFVEVENGRFNDDTWYTTYYDKETLIMYMLVGNALERA